MPIAVTALATHRRASPRWTSGGRASSQDRIVWWAAM